MSIFSSILEKIGIGKPAADAKAAAVAKAAADAKTAADAAAAKAKADAIVTAANAKAAEDANARIAANAAAAQARPAATPAPLTPPTVVAPASMAPASIPAAPVPVRPVAISVVDVVSKLEGLASSHPGLDWKVSIVDLLKLLDIDSGFESRKELATELGCPADQMNDSARMNVWLHKTVLQKIAENGGNIPASLLD